MTRVAVLISGRGSNLEALAKAAKSDEYPAEIALVISNNPDVAGLDVARKFDIPCHIIDHRGFDGRHAFDRALDAALRARDIDLICNAGFMRLHTAEFVDAWRDRQLNIHPSLLPAFKGLNVHARVIDAGVRITGCTVHFLRAEMDEGPIVAQAAVPVSPDDTPDMLADRVRQAEHRLYPSALRLVAEGRARVANERVHLSGSAACTIGNLFVPPVDG